MWIAISIVVLVAGLAWYLLSIPRTIVPDKQSEDALANISHWFGQVLGPNWPMILSVIVALLVIIIILSENITINVPTDVGKIVSLFIVGIGTLLTVKWRQHHVNNTTAAYYIELALIITLLILNIYFTRLF
jgi:hypothetical protein